jgi:hypothetical protein
MFATAILKLAELPPDPKDERVYDLNPLSQKGFDFIFDVGSGIRNVVVRKLRAAASFIVCDKRSDINRVPVSAERQK